MLSVADGNLEIMKGVNETSLHATFPEYVFVKAFPKRRRGGGVKVIILWKTLKLRIAWDVPFHASKRNCLAIFSVCDIRGESG